MVFNEEVWVHMQTNWTKQSRRDVQEEKIKMFLGVWWEIQIIKIWRFYWFLLNTCWEDCAAWSSYFLLLLVLLHHPFSLPPVVFLFITITIISHLAPPRRPLEPHLTPSLALISSLTASPDGCRGEAGLTLILAPVAQCRKPLTSQRGLALEVAVWFPVGPSAICRHTPHRSRRHRARWLLMQPPHRGDDGRKTCCCIQGPLGRS